MEPGWTLRRLLGVVAVAAAVAVSPAGAVPFLQFGVDAARTGATADPGPVTLDVAFNTTAPAEAPGALPWGSFPLILGQAVFALQGVERVEAVTESEEIANPGPGFIERIDLQTAERREVAQLGDAVVVSGFASDGKRLFVTVSNEVRALDPDSGELLWSRPHPRLLELPGSHEVRCQAPAVWEGLIILPCHQVGVVSPGGTAYIVASQPVVLALDAATGTERWRWTPPAHYAQPAPEGDSRAYAFQYSPSAVVMGEGKAFVTVRGFPAPIASGEGPRLPNLESFDAQAGSGRLVALDAASGAAVWDRPLAVPWTDAGRTGAGRVTDSPGNQPGLLYAPGVLYLMRLHLEALDPATGQTLWDLPLVPPGEDLLAGFSLAMFADRLYATAYSVLYAVDVRTHGVIWQTPLPQGEELRSGLILAGGRIHSTTSAGRVFVFDAADGSILDQRDLGADPRFAVGEGVLAALATDGRVIVLGRTPASIQPVVRISDFYPAPGGSVRLDLSGTRPGLLDDRTEYRVDWRDGALTPWSDTAVLEHTYVTPGERMLSVRMRNAAGQEASEILAIDVGGTPPQQLNFMQRAFEPQNLDTTWGLIGLAVVFASALFAVWTRRRHHSILGDELAKLRAIRAQGLDNPAAAARGLEMYEQRTADALTGGRLNDAQFSVLAMQASEVRRTLRKRAVAPLAGIVSPAFRTALDASLEDGRITGAEAQALRRALAKERGLTAARRKDVLHLIDAWGAGA